MFPFLQKSSRCGKVLILISYLIILLAFSTRADLAPNEEEDVEKPLINEPNLASETATPAPKGNLGFIHAFVASFSVIIVSEIGDKTFFIACVMSMKYPRMAVFLGAIAALGVMTVLSSVFGMVFIHFIPSSVTRWVSVALFVFFGLKMLSEGWNMTAANAAEEMEDVQAEIRQREDELNRETSRVAQDDAETGGTKKAKVSAFMMLFRIFMQAFTMTFLAEWGDRSQITTIVLAARENLWGVISGGIIGHAICTGLGVIGGRIIAQKISVRTVTLIGGVVFLVFAITSSIWDPTDTSLSLAKESN